MNKRLKKKFIKELKATIIPKGSILLIEFNTNKFSPKTLQKFNNSLQKIADEKEIKIAFYPQEPIKDIEVITDNKKECKNCVYNLSDYNEAVSKCNPIKCRSKKVCCINSNIKHEFDSSNKLIFNCPCLTCNEDSNNFIAK